jgi:hypothetical protein
MRNLLVLVGAAAVLFAAANLGRGQALLPSVDGNEIVFLNPSLPRRPANSHLVLELQWTVLDAGARGGILARVARDAHSTGEPLFQLFAPVSGFWAPLPGDAGLAPAHCAAFSTPRLGVHRAVVRVFPDSARICAADGDSPRPGFVFAPADFCPENLVALAAFGNGFALDAAAMRWAPSGTMLILR